MWPLKPFNMNMNSVDPPPFMLCLLAEPDEQFKKMSIQISGHNKTNKLDEASGQTTDIRSLLTVRRATRRNVEQRLHVTASSHMATSALRHKEMPPIRSIVLPEKTPTETSRSRRG